MSSIYLDYNATAPARPEVIESVAELLKVPSNPSSVHAFGRNAKKELEEARAMLASCLSCFPAEIVFVSSGTEANHLALHGFAGQHMLVSAVEHASVLAQAQHWAEQQEGRELHFLPVDAEGLLHMSALEEALSGLQGGALVSVGLANNETGVIQPIAEIAVLVHRFGAVLHTDAVQALGKIPLDLGLLGADMISLSAHKMGGVPSAAMLVVREGVKVLPVFRGGRQEERRRAGTENVAAIVGFAEAVNRATKDNWQAGVRAALDAFEAKALAAFPSAVVLGVGAERLPNTTMIAMPNVSSETQLMHFDLSGFAVSNGSACSSGRVEASHVAKAMGIAGEVSGCLLRVSAGWNSQPEDIDRFAKEWLALASRLAA